MKTLKISLGIFLILLLALNCKDKSGDTDQTEDHAGHDMPSADHQAMRPMYKVVESDGVKASFEMSTREFHHKMMKNMYMDINHSTKGDHYLMLTLLNVSDAQVISDVENLELEISLPDGNVVKQKAHVMSGKGMHHFGLDFNYATKGTYKVKANFERAGQNFTMATEFAM